MFECDLGKKANNFDKSFASNCGSTLPNSLYQIYLQ